VCNRLYACVTYTRTASSTLDNDAALYELFAVVTHKGRDADGGHYVAWVRESEGE
jgi:uncharacterized UBP type Zn finger protein